jgi:5'(3')-deoxyribonucleotidase
VKLVKRKEILATIDTYNRANKKPNHLLTHFPQVHYNKLQFLHNKSVDELAIKHC